jgi:hypothetical protein
MYLMTPALHFERATELRIANPNSRAAALHEIAARAMGPETEIDRLAREYRRRLCARA